MHLFLGLFFCFFFFLVLSVVVRGKGGGGGGGGWWGGWGWGGVDISDNSLTAISKAGRKHGFEVAPFFCGNKIYTQNMIDVMCPTLDENSA